MAKVKQEMRQMQQLVMSDFCYDFCKKLLGKLKTLKMEDRVFEEGNRVALEKEKENYGTTFTPIAYSVVMSLGEQINYSTGETFSPSNLDEFIKTAEEFLAIFEEEK